MRKLLPVAAMLAALLTPIMALAAQGVDAVAVFYDDGTYRLETWDNIENLVQVDERYVKVAVYHVQTPGDFPNSVVFNGSEELALRRTGQALHVMEKQYSPVANLWSIFTQAPVGQGQQLHIPWPGQVYTIFAAAQVRILSRLPFDQTYDDLTTRADAMINVLRSAPVPSTGTY